MAWDEVRKWRGVWAAIVLWASAGCGTELGAPIEQCGVLDPQTTIERPLRTSGVTEVGISHVAGQYMPPQSDGPMAGEPENSFLLAGAHEVLSLGAKTIKVYLTPNYREVYPGRWPDSVSTLAELAQTDSFQTLFTLPFDTFVLTTYSFSLGSGHPWRAEHPPAGFDSWAEMMRREEDEFAELAAYLLRTFEGSGKTFILQNWEGDWALLGGYDPEVDVAPEVADRMATWITARQNGVDRARACYSDAQGVRVLNAVEANRVLDADGTRVRVATHVLPHVDVDMVSYSAWEALWFDASADADKSRDQVLRQLDRALGRLQNSVPNRRVPLYLGEFGFPEASLKALGASGVGHLVEAVIDHSQAHDISHAVYWQIFDNECEGPGVDCPGYWVRRPDGSLSEAGEVLKNRLQG